MRTSVQVTTDNLNIQTCYDFVQEPSCGGIALFVGTVRNASYKKEVTQLNFSAYTPMAVKELQKIADKALVDFDILKIAIHHAIGNLHIGDIPVVIAVSAAHRQAAFDACQFAIDTLKEKVPIFKKEFFSDGAVWVNAHP